MASFVTVKRKRCWVRYFLTQHLFPCTVTMVSIVAYKSGYSAESKELTEEYERYIHKVHNALLTELACDYLHHSIDRGLYLQRFKQQARNYLEAPVDRSLTDPRDILDALEKKGLLAPGNYDALLDIVKGIDVAIEKKIHAAHKFIKAKYPTEVSQAHAATNETKSEDVLNKRPTEKELSAVSRLIGFDFQLVGVELGVDNIKIQQIIMSNPNDAQTQIFQTLIAWKQKASREATVGKLYNVLKSRDVDMIKFKKIFGLPDDI